MNQCAINWTAKQIALIKPVSEPPKFNRIDSEHKLILKAMKGRLTIVSQDIADITGWTLDHSRRILRESARRGFLTPLKGKGFSIVYAAKTGVK